jgi:hypothetical protein
MAEYNINSVEEMRKLYKEQNGVENVDQFEKRVLEAFSEIQNEKNT